jgi:hypothetical protein
VTSKQLNGLFHPLQLHPVSSPSSTSTTTLPITLLISFITLVISLIAMAGNHGAIRAFAGAVHPPPARVALAPDCLETIHESLADSLSNLLCAILAKQCEAERTDALAIGVQNEPVVTGLASLAVFTGLPFYAENIATVNTTTTSGLAIVTKVSALVVVARDL